MLIAAMPIKKMESDAKLPKFTLPIFSSTQPTSMLKSAQMTLTVGDESPLPGGLEKGDGNLFPETPCTKCGTAFAKKVPAKKLAMYRYHCMAIRYHQSAQYENKENTPYKTSRVIEQILKKTSN